MKSWELTINSCASLKSSLLPLFRLMDKLWLREGLDLKMVTFACVPTGHRHGMVELVTEAKTLREIQVG
jgi:phosphatidylinositol-4-phosphate 3-kinase